MKLFYKTGLMLMLMVVVNSSTAMVKQDTIVTHHFLNFFQEDQSIKERGLAYIDKNWSTEFVIMVLETVNLTRDPWVQESLVNLLHQKTGERFGLNFNQWYKWLWSKPARTTDDYPNFKAGLYKKIDPKFELYFAERFKSDIRLDEVRWGGVKQDGIPPLRSPKMIEAPEADYLEDDHVVFGIEVNGDVRAYPKRILAWHEMFVDEVGGINVAGVYCTLCGTVILYNTTHNGIDYQIGTSGFLYRSNKLMYDKSTQSLWNTLWGSPVLGPLRGKGIQLEKMSVVTTTWGEWKRRHPETKVLSLATGHRRNYGEGAAYKDYFSSDRLMFNTPFDDNRLKNKDEVLALQFPEYPRGQMAISTEFLKRRPVYQNNLGKVKFVVLTDSTGANRVYEAKQFKFKSFDGDRTITDRDGDQWILHENRIERVDGEKLDRLSYHRAFWFGWKAAYPNTKLIK